MIQARTTGSVRSVDGTLIAYERGGSGPPLVLVHGTPASRTRWAPVLPAFEARRSVYAVDRRGHGDSGDTLPYSIEREFEDVAAVVDAVASESGRPVDLLGHSFGGMCALAAALLSPNVRRLVVYEGAPAGVLTVPTELVERMQAQIDAGDRDGAAQTMLRDIVGAPEQQIARSQHLPHGPGPHGRDPVPTLLLLGGESPAFFRTTAEAAQQAIPQARLTVLPGQQHAAMDTAPDLFVREVLAFLDADE